MAEFTEDDKKKLDELHTAIVEQKVLIDKVVVSKAECEVKRKEIYDTIHDCAETQCEKIDKAGKISQRATKLAIAAGSIAAILIALAVYLLTKGG